MADRLISVDDHVQEPPDLWASRLSKSRWGDRVPHVERQPDGTERWVVDGKPIPLGGVASAQAVMPDRSAQPQRWEDVPRVVYDPAERLRAMDADGVDYSVLYPTVAGVGGETFGRLTDPDLELACVQAYNDWLIEGWAAASPRFIPQCIVPLWPAEATIGEMRRAVAKGHRGVVYPAVPMELREVPHINGPEYDPIWSACEELGVPICFHAGSATSIQAPPHGLSPKVADAFGAITRSASTVALLVNLLISRLLLRHPELKVVLAESTLGWGPYLLEYVDHQFREDGLDRDSAYTMKPSEMFRQHCYLTGWYDRAAIQTRRFIGAENILWATNFPLATSTWPNTRETIERCLEGVPPDEREAILWGNAARLYRLS